MKNESVYNIQCITSIENEDKSRDFRLVTNHGLKFTIHLSKSMWALVKCSVREVIENERKEDK